MKYILVKWPDSQYLMGNKRFNECLSIQNIKGHDNVGHTAFVCPEDLYNEIFYDRVKQ